MTGYLEERANLAGKVAAVGGGGHGIGGGCVLALAKAGLDLVVCDINEASLDAIAAEVRKLGRRIETIVADAADPQALDRFYDLAEAAYPRLDVVLNIAGGTRRIDFMDNTPETVRRDIQLNYEYIVQSVQRAVPLIRRQDGGGSIVNFTTIEAHRGAATYAVYAGAKAATANFSRAVGVELAKHRIRVNCIAPDTTPTPNAGIGMAQRHKDGMAALPPDIRRAGMDMYIPMKEQPPVDALSDAVLFLASDMSRFMTGVTLHVDGGTMAACGFLDWPFGDSHLCVPLDGTLNRMYAPEIEEANRSA